MPTAILEDMADVLVYTTENCPFCIRAKALLDTRGVQYRELNLERDPEGRAELVKQTGMMTFPQVIIDGELVGGFQETLAADRAGPLAEMLAQAAGGAGRAGAVAGLPVLATTSCQLHAGANPCAAARCIHLPGPPAA